MSDAVERVRSAIEEAIDGGSDGRMLACRVELSGTATIHESLMVSAEHILAEARAVARGFGEEAAWIERVVVSTEPLRGEDADAGEILGDLHDILGGAAADADLHKLLRSDLGDMIAKLPADLRNSIDDTVLSAALGSDYPALAEHAREYLSALLKAGKD